MALKNQYSTNLGLTELPEINQQKYPDIWAEFYRLRTALRSLQGTLDLYTGALGEDPAYWAETPMRSSARVQNISRIYAKASEAISTAQIVNLYNNAGELNAQKANGTDATKPCRAFSAGVVASGDFGEFILLGVNPYYSALSPGAEYFLYTTSGQITATAPSSSGNIVQKIGFALSDTDLWFDPALTWAQIP